MAAIPVTGRSDGKHNPDGIDESRSWSPRAHRKERCFFQCAMEGILLITNYQHWAG